MSRKQSTRLAPTPVQGREGGRVEQPPSSSPAQRAAGRERLVVGLQSARRTGALHVLVLMLLPVPFLLIAHYLYYTGVAPFGSARWNVNSDRSVIEVLGYVQLLLAASLLLMMGLVRRHGPVYAGWAVALTVVMLDDALFFHERAGVWLATRLSIPPVLGLPEQPLAELLAWGLMGVPVLVVLVVTHRLSPTRARRDSWVFVGLTVLLMAFAVGVDTFHSLIETVTDSTKIDTLISFLEAAGEVGAMTAMLAYAVHVVRRVGSDETEDRVDVNLTQRNG